MNATTLAQRKIDLVARLKAGVEGGKVDPADLARRMRIDPETVRLWLTDKSLPSGRRVDDLARALSSMGA